SSGVSIEQKHFDRHFGMFCGEVVPSDAIQMLRRDRTAKEFIIGFDKVRARRETDPQKIERAFVQALLATAGMNGELTDVVFDGDRISMGVANTDFTRMKIKAAAIEASARNDYQQYDLHNAQRRLQGCPPGIRRAGELRRQGAAQGSPRNCLGTNASPPEYRNAERI
ncbi:hypothetical protein, partial [Klebsiella pneumoniae]|uniref:hypothetical protein n=1 Tax=Klebsiella pneumoniae TaxID=573 RepID=UPI001D0D8320